MAREAFDVVIVGGGNAAFGVTVPTRKAGLKVAMIEQRDLGGTCPNRGCTPKKVLVAAAHAMHEIGQAHVHCIEVGKPKLDWAALIDREKDMISGIPDSLGETLQERGVELVRAAAKFVGPNAVEAGGRRLEAKHIVIATGSTPRPLPIPGAELMITSDEVLSERELPESVLFVGGGVVALEFGHVYARAGAKVTILEVLPRLLPALDADAVEQVRKESVRIGIDVHTGVKVKRIEKTATRLRTVFEVDGKEMTVESDRVVNGAGRIANVGALDLDAGNIAHDGFRVMVDETLRSTSNPSVYLCGDVLSGPPQLSPLATYEGKLVGLNIVEGPRQKPDYSALPTAVYTVPALATVGLSEAKAKEKGLRTRVQVNDMEYWFSTRQFAETAAWSKIIVEEESDAIIGAHFVGHAGEELINLFGLAMKHGIKAAQVRDFIYAYPTFSADIKHML
ncbi:NAD(P)/FAD-dependent oxidoreductase [Methyloceanibacter sp.]|uniref:dihydrolipoyl dehydrogenase family protein n=1 Tax=Methyloceanibacter sp. TaxID=1965321 RepID=UPI002D67F214|nr:NAD(P)/FAD-dependent oxidoreductase [Methyloceanibacter sp.]HZP09529.1 NAD(P)/FAD-dependent oxidoreductase [Methyloceanibacter sp.]